MALEKGIDVEADFEEACLREKNDDAPPKTCYQRLRDVVSTITVEPVFAMYLLPSTMAGIATQNLTIEKACRINLQLDEKICDALSSRNISMYNDTDEIYVQKFVASLYAWKNVVQSLLPAVLLLFLGSWSDRHQRRKPCIILPIFGEAVSSLCFLICTYFFYELSAEYCVLSEAVPPSLTGGWFAMHMAVYSYIGTISNVETRTVRVGAISTFSYVTYTVGIALSGVVFLAVGFYGVFSISFAMEVLGIIYAYIRIKDIVNINSDTNQVEKVNFFKDFFRLSHISDTFKVAFKKGKRNRKMRICVIMFLVMVTCGPLYGEYAVMYLFTRYKFHWNEFEFSVFCTFNAIIITFATILSLSILSNRLKLDDALIGVISCLSKIVSAVIYALAPNTYVFYLGTIAECLVGTTQIAIKSLISKLVAPDELGKIYSLFGVCEALMPLIYAPLYSLVYKWTINVVPGAFYLMGGVLTLPSVFIFFWLYLEHKHDEKELKKCGHLKDELLNEKQEIETKQ
ncbi:hypothetical protein FQR65_LT05861 [Abscondita terminalis]|nr:hypothetical protein FQR65_LT05861 [Abscondita terminalis]